MLAPRWLLRAKGESSAERRPKTSEYVDTAEGAADACPSKVWPRT